MSVQMFKSIWMWPSNQHSIVKKSSVIELTGFIQAELHCLSVKRNVCNFWEINGPLVLKRNVNIFLKQKLDSSYTLFMKEPKLNLKLFFTTKSREVLKCERFTWRWTSMSTTSWHREPRILYVMSYCSNNC